MAQFDVFRNPGRHREFVPFVVVLQSARFDRAPTRLVAPLVLQSLALIDEHYLAPRFTVGGREVVLDVFNLATVFADKLGSPLASLADEESRSKLSRAVDDWSVRPDDGGPSASR